MKIQTKHRYGKWEKQTNKQTEKQDEDQKEVDAWGIAPQNPNVLRCGKSLQMIPQQPCRALLPSPLAAARWKNRKDVRLQIGQQPLSKGSHLVRFTHTCISSSKKMNNIGKATRPILQTLGPNWWERHSVMQNVTLRILITPPSKPQTPISRWLFTTTWSAGADHNVCKSDYYSPGAALVLLSFK